MTDAERRARLAVRHALAPAARAGSPEAAVEAMTVLHATEPATVYLSCWARVPGVTIADIDRALYGDRSLVKQLAMRRTLFVFPRDLLGAALPSCSARVAATERARVAKDVVTVGLATDGIQWLERATGHILEQLAETPDGLTAQEIRQAIPAIDVRVELPGGESWGAPRLLVQLGATAEIMRGMNTGHWRTSRPRWTLTRNWLGEDIPLLSPADGYRELVRRWLYSFGPGTEADIVWWLGSTKTVVRAALAGLGAVAVSLDGGGTGWLLAEDLDEVTDPGPWVALLPVLDPTVMGWRARDFYLGAHSERLFEARGNAGTTAWVNGRIVGCWVQDAAGEVLLHLVESISAGERSALAAEADRLTGWLAGERVATGYMSPAMKDAVALLGPGVPAV
ncbi:MAG: hypothetical protein JWQ43_2809 [Glaciihabitans sp.]|nr:hypothetical protein [Glaciihabitans sp.]